MTTKFLTMNIYINAWLDCRHPFISIHNKVNDDLLAYFNSEEANQLIENGEITLNDLQSTDPKTQMEVVTNLIEIKSNEKIQPQINNISRQIKQRKLLFLTPKREVANEPITDLKVADMFSLFNLKTV